MSSSDRDHRDGDVVLAAGLQRKFDERAGRRGRSVPVQKRRDVCGVGQVVPQPVDCTTAPNRGP